MSGAFGKSSTKQSSKSASEPWKPTIPYLTDYLGQIGDLATEPLTSTQMSAVGDLKDIYGEGNPFQEQLTNLANDFFTGPQSQSGMIGDAYASLQKQLSPYAEGKFVDFNSNPYIQQMLSEVGDSVQQRINAQFAGAGRDLSGMNQRAVGQGVTAAQLPILADLYNQEQNRALGAANTLFTGANTAATGMQGLDTSALTTRGAAPGLATAAMDAELWGPQGLFNLEQTVSESPFQKLGLLGNLLLPVAQLGQQQTGSGKSSTSGFNIGGQLLSDERLKENIQEIGQMADGTPMVRFNYKGDPTVRIGVRAQDVEELSPEAITEYSAPQAGTDDGNVKYVDMDLATRRSAEMMASGMPGMIPAGEMGPVGMNTPTLPPPSPRPLLDDELFMQAEPRAA